MRRLVHEVFEATVKRSPQACALAQGEVRVSFDELNRRANRLARHLLALGVDPEEAVAISLGRSPEMAVAVLAVLKAGGCFVPLDPFYPEERRQYQLAESQADFLIDEAFFKNERAWADLEDSDLFSIARPESLALLLYTSGSTGAPKGVMLEHRNLLATLESAAEALELRADDRFPTHASPAFGIAAVELLMPLLRGATVVLVKSERQRDLPSLVAQTEEATFFHAVPSLMDAWLDHLALQPRDRYPNLRTILVGGEPVSRQMLLKIRAAFPQVAIVELYGSAEVGVISLCYRWTQGPVHDVPFCIGKNFSCSRSYVLDEQRRPVADGEVGELYIAGDAVARGYWRRADLTAQRFFDEPGRPGGRIYQTGDRVRRLPDGSLEHRGRADFQVKIRGMRVELGEIESRLAEHPKVRRAVVVAREDGKPKHLVAYVVPNRAGTLQAGELRESLARFLPDYMVPSAVVFLPALPLNPNGKVDRARLPAPTETPAAKPFLAPQTEAEHALAAAVEAVLGRRPVNLGANFIELGGDSVSVLQVLNRLQAAGYRASVRQMFERPTLQALAAELPAMEGAPSAVSVDNQSDIALPSGERQLIEKRYGKDLSAIYPLTPLQEGMLFHSLLDPTAGAYIEHLSWTMPGELDADAFENAWRDLVARHDVLRTFFVWEEVARPLQVVREKAELLFTRLDWRAASETDRSQRLARFVAAEQSRPFRLDEAPLMRLALIRLGDDAWRFVWTHHHAIFDGWSLPILMRELFAFYQARVTGTRAELPPTAPFRNLVRWLETRDANAARNFWQEELRGFESPTPLAFGAIPSDRQDHCELIQTLPPALCESLLQLARRERLTLNTVMQGAWAILLARYADEAEVVFGSTVAGRPPELPGAESSVGLYINTLPVRARLPEQGELLPWLRELQSAQVRRDEFAHTPLTEIQKASEIPSGTRLFDTLLVFGNHPTAQGLSAHSKFALKDFQTLEHTHFPLSVGISTDAGIAVRYLFECARLDAATVDRLARNYQALLQAIAQAPQTSIAQLPLAIEHETSRPAVDYPAELTIPALFARQVAKRPNAVAVYDGTTSLTYRELDTRAEHLARALRQAGVQPESPVAVCLDRSAALLVAILGVWKAGGCYVPLDPAHPEERRAFVRHNSEARWCLDEHSLAEWEARGPRIAPVPLLEPSPQALAYLIYTSGSTGRPKGVCVEHRALAITLLSAAKTFEFSENDSLPAHASTAFDISLLELWLPLIAGGRTQPITAASAKDLPALVEITQGATYFHGVPSLIEAWLDYLGDEAARKYAGLRTVLLGGDAVHEALLHRLKRTFPQAKVRELYGPTEAVIIATQHDFDPTTSPRVPHAIGRPFDYSQVKVLDRNQQPAPAGAIGELYLGGEALAREYRGQPETTAEKFVFIDEKRWYRTGDRARLLPDGSFEFLGRRDQQVKLRGFRIELGEIESQILRHPTVRTAAVLVREDRPGDKRLVAYVVGREGFTAGALREALAKVLPDYFLPAAIVDLPELPLNANGKIDRRRLPAPEYRADAQYVAPRTATEKTLSGIYAEVLGANRVGAEDGFFELGGNSLLATQAIARLRRAFRLDVPLKALFETPKLCDLAAFVDKLAAANPVAPQAEEIPRLPREAASYLPSYAQERLWFVDQLETQGFGGSSSAYVLSLALQSSRPLDPQRLRTALQQLRERQEILRVKLVEIEGQARQVLEAPAEFDLPILDLRDCDEDQRAARRQSALREHFATSLELAGGTLFRARLLLEPSESTLLVNFHHAISDGWSLAVFRRELRALYEGQDLAPLSVQYVDYAAWQRSPAQALLQQRELAYWEKQLEGLPPFLTLPTDHPRPTRQTFNGAEHAIALSPALTKSLRAISQQLRATPFMVYTAAFAWILSRYSGQNDIAIGTPVANRARPDTENLLGFFVNTLVLRSRLDPAASFRDLLAQTKNVCLEAYAHQEVPFERLVSALNPERSLAHSPLFQAFLVLEGLAKPEPVTPGLELAPIPSGRTVAKYDLTLTLVPQGGGLRVGFKYNTDLFEPATIERFANHFTSLLQAIVREPAKPLGELPLLSASEEATLRSWSTGPVVPLSEPLWHRAFEQQARRTPDQIAVVCDSRQWTYRQLDEASNRLARHLRARGAGPERTVAIFLERGSDMILAPLAVSKAGSAFAPIDPAYPSERVRFLLDDNRAPFVLTHSHLRDRLPAHDAEVIEMDSSNAAWRTESAESLHELATAETLAYVIHTSGSTGRPKGVSIEHRGLANLAEAQATLFGVSPASRVLHFASTSFDASVSEMAMALVRGATLYVASNEVRSNGLEPYLVDKRITVATLPPSVLATLSAANCPDLKTLILAGEACREEQVEEWGAQRRVFNAYGPTEVTVCATVALCQPGAGKPVIGRPIANQLAYVLDERGQLAPIGVPGELYLGGMGLARSYRNRPELTDEKFVVIDGQRLYRSGDRARWRADGQLDFLGRGDHQIKLRGFRIEPGEIESVLGELPKVREALVMVREDRAGDRKLVAYVVTRPGVTLDPLELRDHARAFLPEYFLPAAFVVLNEWPLTPNQKIDRRALPAPDFVSSAQGSEPRTAAETQLTKVVAEVLGLERVGADANFFEIGGDSILALQVVARAKALGLELSVRRLIEHATLAQAAASCVGSAASAPAPVLDESDPHLPLTPIQRAFFASRPPKPGYFNQAFVLRPTEKLDPRRLAEALQQVAAAHDAFALRFRRTSDGWSQVIEPEAERVSFEHCDSAFQPEKAQSVQSSLSLKTGPLFKAILFSPSGSDRQRLLLVAHHLVVDAVSWRILLSDLETAYRGGTLPAQALSWRTWSHQLEHRRAAIVSAEETYWQSVEQAPTTLPVDRERDRSDNTHGAARKLERVLDRELTEKLLRELPAHYGAQINELLLAALSPVLGEWSGDTSLRVDVEGHGREELYENADLSRTVGWFTSVYPVALSTRPNSPSRAVAATKETLRAIPQRGFGYGLRPNSVFSQIGFNYLGQVDSRGNGLFAVAEESAGATVDPDFPRWHLIDINSRISDGCLIVQWTYASDFHDEATIAGLADAYQLRLRQLAESASAAQETDLPEYDEALLGEDEVQALLERYV